MDGRPTHGRQWLDDYQHRLAELRARATAVQARLATVSGAATSRDGAVSVTVAPGGALRELRLSPRAQQLSLVQLAALVVATSAEATAAAQRTVTEVAAPLLEARR